MPNIGIAHTLVPFSPGTTTAQDKYGNVTGVRLTAGDPEVWQKPIDEIVADLQSFQYQPMEQLAPMWMAEALRDPIENIISPPAPTLLLMSSTGSTSSPALGASQACELLKLVPYLGPFLAGSCTATSVVVGGLGIYAWLTKFTGSRYAVYFRGTLLTVLTAGAAQVFMENAKRQVRDQVRLRKAGN